MSLERGFHGKLFFVKTSYQLKIKAESSQLFRLSKNRLVMLQRDGIINYFVIKF